MQECLRELLQYIMDDSQKKFLDTLLQQCSLETVNQFLNKSLVNFLKIICMNFWRSPWKIFFENINEKNKISVDFSKRFTRTIPKATPGRILEGFHGNFSKNVNINVEYYLNNFKIFLRNSEIKIFRTNLWLISRRNSHAIFLKNLWVWEIY